MTYASMVGLLQNKTGRLSSHLNDELTLSQGARPTLFQRGHAAPVNARVRQYTVPFLTIFTAGHGARHGSNMRGNAKRITAEHERDSRLVHKNMKVISVLSADWFVDAAVGCSSCHRDVRWSPQLSATVRSSSHPWTCSTVLLLGLVEPMAAFLSPFMVWDGQTWRGAEPARGLHTLWSPSREIAGQNRLANQTRLKCVKMGGSVLELIYILIIYIYNI